MTMIRRICRLALLTASTAVPSSPVISEDESLVCLAGASAEVRCIQADRGRTQWSDQTSGIMSAAPVVLQMPNAPSVLFFAEESTGLIRQYNMQTGVLNWRASPCVDEAADVSCSSSVEADFR